MNKIFVIGSSNTDMVVKTDKLPLPGETRLGGTFYMNAGGKGANQAVAASRLGAAVKLICKLGNDIFGRQTLANFKNENIDVSDIFMDEGTASGTALIIVNAEGENSIVVAPGANANLLPPDIDRIKDLSEAELVLMQLEIPLETLTYAAEKLKANHQRLIINPAPAQTLDDRILNGLFLITPNESEAFLLTGIQVTDEDSASAAAAVFLKKGVQNIIITVGNKGAYFQNNHLKIKLDAPQVEVMDTTAAGDVFNGAIAVALMEKMDWKQAVEFAIEAASLSVTRMGAQSSVPYRYELKS
jgi:ribokinase